MQEKSVLRLHKTYYGMCREGTRGGEGMGSGDLGGSKGGKIEE